LYAYLSHGDGFAVLLNRVGRTSLNDFGYTTAGFAVTLTLNAPTDIHNYQSASPIYNGNGQLTGIWRADGRDENPLLTLDTTASTATLISFEELNPNGLWTLYFRDVSPGGISTLHDISVQITTIVPEPTSLSLLGIFGIAWLLNRSRRIGLRQLQGNK
jgi:hypothetical protein